MRKSNASAVSSIFQFPLRKKATTRTCVVVVVVVVALRSLSISYLLFSSHYSASSLSVSCPVTNKTNMITSSQAAAAGSRELQELLREARLTSATFASSSVIFAGFGFKWRSRAPHVWQERRVQYCTHAVIRSTCLRVALPSTLSFLSSLSSCLLTMKASVAVSTEQRD